MMYANQTTIRYIAHSGPVLMLSEQPTHSGIVRTIITPSIHGGGHHFVGHIETSRNAPHSETAMIAISPRMSSITIVCSM